MSPYPVKNPALVATIEKGWQKLAEAQPEKYKSKFDMLFDMYVNQGMSQPEIGARLGKCGHTINKQCQKLGIKMRPQGGSRKKKEEVTTWPFRCKKCGDTLYGDQRKVGLCVYCDPSIGFSAGSAEDVKVIY